MWQQNQLQQKKRVQLVSHNNHHLQHEHEHLRQRPRADTMPSSLGISESSEITSSITGGAGGGGGMSGSTISSSSSMFRHRSGSITLPPSNNSPFGDGIFNINNNNKDTSTNNNIDNTHTPWSNDPKSPTTPTTDQLLKGDDGNTIASTLASLGLDDVERDHRRHTIHASHSYSSLHTWYNNQSQSSSTQQGSTDIEPWPLSSSTATNSRGTGLGGTHNHHDHPTPHHHHHPRPASTSHPQGLMMTGVASKLQAQRPRAISMSVADNRPPFENNSNNYLSPHHRSIWQPHQKQIVRRPQEGATMRLRSSNSSADLLEMMARQKHRTSRGSSGTPTTGEFMIDDWDTPNTTSGIDECSSSSSPISSSNTTIQQQQQQPTRSLWIGNIDPTLTMNDLQCIFSQFGIIDTIRILPDRECAFINFITLDDALRAKEELIHTLNGRLGNSAVKVGFGRADAVPQQPPPPPPTSQSTTTTTSTTIQQQQQVTSSNSNSGELVGNAQGPTRALWIGNIPSSTTYSMLFSLFSPFGAIESVRVLTHKNCGFVNFELQEDAVRAKKMLQGKELLGPATGTVRIGFAKVPSLPTTAASSTTATTATLPSSSGMTPMIAPPAATRHDYSNFDPMMTPTAIESTENNYLNSAPFGSGWSPANSSPATGMMPNNNMNGGYQDQQQMMMFMMAEMMGNGSPNIYAAIASERQILMNELGGTEDESDGPFFDEMHMPSSYFANIPAAPELAQARKIDIGRLRDIRKRLDTGYVPTKELEVIALECLDELVELCSDHIGNTVIQRLFERCSEVTKSRMLDVVSPYLASIGIHKNGTWAAQKIIDTGRLPIHINRICASIKPYVPALLLDQFGNYVVQCCLGLGPERNQFIFDAIVDNCWEIAQGRFGARAVRATLESPHVTKRQQKYVAATIIQQALVLATNANGALLLIWLLDTSGISGRYRVLAPRLTPHLARLCTHKLASLTVLKLINQRHEPDARALILDALVFNNSNTHNHSSNNHNVNVIDEVLKDQVHGVNLVQKILSSSYVELRERQRIAERIKHVLVKLKLQHVQGYKRLMEEINMVMGDSNPGASLGALPGLVPPSFAMNPEMAAAFHAKYLAAAAAAVQAVTTTTNTTNNPSSSPLINNTPPSPAPPQQEDQLRTSIDQQQGENEISSTATSISMSTTTTTTVAENNNIIATTTAM
ncbi:hypothetical protein BDC45DRAFT_174934 [Circinella umbellata]|nr:hypothetical protein BDC45DRAFT_174934 [Circinella umbellata]